MAVGSKEVDRTSAGSVVPPVARYDTVTEPPLPFANPGLLSRDALDRSLSSPAKHRRDTILEAIAKSARDLFHSSAVADSLPNVLELIGRATDVTRVHRGRF